MRDEEPACEWDEPRGWIEGGGEPLAECFNGGGEGLVPRPIESGDGFHQIKWPPLRLCPAHGVDGMINLELTDLAHEDECFGGLVDAGFHKVSDAVV